MLKCHFSRAGPTETELELREARSAKRRKRAEQTKPRLTPDVLPACEELIRVPRAWFFNPLRQSMRRLVRPCTALTRRKQLTIKKEIPLRVFEQLMSTLGPEDVKGLNRTEVAGRLIPTKQTKNLRRYEYVINKGSALNKFFNLESADRRPEGRSKALWRRSLGCGRLFLGAAAEKRGQKALQIAMVCGNCVIQLLEPTGFRAIPRLTIRMFVLSMDQTGHIIWPVDFAAKTRAALRKQLRHLVAEMLEQQDMYPISEEFRQGLTNAPGDSILQLVPRGDRGNMAMPSPVPLRPPPTNLPMHPPPRPRQHQTHQ